MIKRIFSILAAAMIGVAAFALDLPVKEINGKPYYYYIVKKGDTVYSLVSRFGITKQQLITSNPSAAGILKAGETLYFAVDEFGDGKPYVIEREPQEEPMPEGRVKHHVKKGETLYGISKQYGVSQEQIVTLNPRVRNGVKTGMILEIPVKAEPAPEPDVNETVTTDESGMPPINYQLKPVRPAIVEVGAELPEEDVTTAPDDSDDEDAIAD